MTKQLYPTYPKEAQARFQVLFHLSSFRILQASFYYFDVWRGNGCMSQIIDFNFSLFSTLECMLQEVLFS